MMAKYPNVTAHVADNPSDNFSLMLIGSVKDALVDAGLPQAALEWTAVAIKANDSIELLQIAREWVNVRL